MRKTPIVLLYLQNYWALFLFLTSYISDTTNILPHRPVFHALGLHSDLMIYFPGAVIFPQFVFRNNFHMTVSFLP